MNTLKALENYIDYKEYGDDTALNENGVFTDYGYVVCNQSDFKEIYNGSRDDIPDEYRISSIPDIEAEQKDAVKTEEKSRQFVSSLRKISQNPKRRNPYR